MTTIAYRDGVMAADTLAISGPFSRKAKKLHRADDAIIGFSGNLCDGLEFIRWWQAGHDLIGVPQFITYGERDAPDFSALVLSREGLELWSEHFLPIPLLNEFEAIGSGAMAALAAMHMGANAIEAVKVAAMVDHGTGGEVVWEKL